LAGKNDLVLKREEMGYDTFKKIRRGMLCLISFQKGVTVNFKGHKTEKEWNVQH